MCCHQMYQARRHYACLTTPNVGLVERKCPYGAPLPQTLGNGAFIDPLSNQIMLYMICPWSISFLSFFSLMQICVFSPNHAPWEISCPQEDPDKVDGQDVTIPPWTASTREAQKTEDFLTARLREGKSIKSITIPWYDTELDINKYIIWNEKRSM